MEKLVEIVMSPVGSGYEMIRDIIRESYGSLRERTGLSISTIDDDETAIKERIGNGVTFFAYAEGTAAGTVSVSFADEAPHPALEEMSEKADEIKPDEREDGSGPDGAEPEPGAAYGKIIYMGVLPEFQGTGIGKMLIDTAAAYASDRGVRTLVLSTSWNNKGAIAFYEKNGFGIYRVSGNTRPIAWMARWQDGRQVSEEELKNGVITRLVASEIDLKKRRKVLLERYEKQEKALETAREEAEQLGDKAGQLAGEIQKKEQEFRKEKDSLKKDLRLAEKEKKKLAEELEQLEKERKKYRDKYRAYKKAFGHITESKFWKMTALLRKMSGLKDDVIDAEIRAAKAGSGKEKTEIAKAGPKDAGEAAKTGPKDAGEAAKTGSGMSKAGTDAAGNGPLVSVGIAVYNAERFIPDLLTQLKNQTLKDAEFIFVDDGSTDKTAQMIEAAAAEDPRFRLVRQEHGGAGKAKNRSIAEARGKYFISVDADDIQPPEKLKKMAETAEKYSAEMVISKYTRLDLQTGESEVFGYGGCPENTVFAAADLDPEILRKMPFKITATNRMYLREFLISTGIRYSESLYLDDLVYALKSVSKAGRIVCIPDNLETVRRFASEDSVTGRAMEYLEQGVRNMKELFPWADEQNLAEPVRDMLMCYVFDSIKFITRYGYKKEFYDAVEELFELPPWRDFTQEKARKYFRFRTKRLQERLEGIEDKESETARRLRNRIEGERLLGEIVERKLRRPEKKELNNYYAEKTAFVTGDTVEETERKIKEAKKRTHCRHDEYFFCRFYELTEEEQGRVFLLHHSKILREKYDVSPEYKELLKNKAGTNEYYSRFIRRKWVLNIECAEEEFLKTFAGTGKIIYKPLRGNCGKGIETFDTEKQTLSEIYGMVSEYPEGTVEEFICQHPELNGFTESSVNTVRIVSIVKKPEGDDPGFADIVYAALRIGGGNACVDNLHSGGMVALADMTTGTLISDGANREGEFFEFHPVSGKRIKGFKIPFFDEAVELVKEGCRMRKTVGCLGWDIAITPNGPELVEVNTYPGADVLELPFAREHMDSMKVMEKYL